MQRYINITVYLSLSSKNSNYSVLKIASHLRVIKTAIPSIIKTQAYGYNNPLILDHGLGQKILSRAK